MALLLGQTLARGHVPEGQGRGAIAATGQDFATRSEANTVPRTVKLPGRTPLLARGWIPEAERAILSPRRQIPAVRGEGQGANPVVVPSQQTKPSPQSHVPQANGRFAVSRRRQRLAVG